MNSYQDSILASIVKLKELNLDSSDWQLVAETLEDLQQGFHTLHNYRHTRKIAVFGSARLANDSPEYQVALEFARRMTELKFMVVTGAGRGIMEAANRGAGIDNSLGLNIKLPFEQNSNPYIHEDKLITFKYFFTRKLFFLRESDAVALFPGGFGTQDEAFETLTLCQTGKYGPVPLVLIDVPGGNYWYSWNEYICEHLMAKGLASVHDSSLYTITDNLDEACEVITNFYRVYHSSYYVDNFLVMRLHGKLSDVQLKGLNKEFSDIVVKGQIEQFDTTSGENLPRLVFHFNQKAFGRLYQMIARLNQWVVCSEAPCSVELR